MDTQRRPQELEQELLSVADNKSLPAQPGGGSGGQGADARETAIVPIEEQRALLEEAVSALHRVLDPASSPGRNSSTLVAAANSILDRVWSRAPSSANTTAVQVNVSLPLNEGALARWEARSREQGTPGGQE